MSQSQAGQSKRPVGYAHAHALFRRLDKAEHLPDYQRRQLAEERERLSRSTWRCSRCGVTVHGIIEKDAERGCPDDDPKNVQWGADNHWYQLVDHGAETAAEFEGSAHD
jgi:hypothetical protein